MIIFKNKQFHTKVLSDISRLLEFNDLETHTGQKGVVELCESLYNELYCNLTVDAATEVERLSSLHPDSDVEDLIKFLVFKETAQVISAKEFALKGYDIDEDVVSQVRVYEGDFYIEIDGDGRHSLTLENSSWSEPETSLETMELELFSFSRVAGG